MEFLTLKNLYPLPVFIGEEIWHFSLLKSGFQKAKELIDLYPKSAHGRILIAEEISEAKGRFQRTWLANKGGLWCVLTLYDELLPENHNLLSIFIGLALIRTIRSLGLSEVYLKWINDIHYKGKKLAGVLLQRYNDWILCGLGLNVNNPLPSTLPAINMKSLLKKEVSIHRVLEVLILWLNYYYKMLWDYEKKHIPEHSDKNPLIEDLKAYSDTLGKCVYYSYNLEAPEEGIFGIAIDFTEKGALIISTKESLIEVSSGEIIYI
ncbi:MAG: biotin--[acetyl-CoA-carboxylase] ligase [Caldimicrobium sp.]